MSFRSLLEQQIVADCATSDHGRWAQFREWLYRKLHNLPDLRDPLSIPNKQLRKHHLSCATSYTVNEKDLKTFSDQEFLKIVDYYYIRKWVQR